MVICRLEVQFRDKYICMYKIYRVKRKARTMQSGAEMENSVPKPESARKECYSISMQWSLVIVREV